MNLTDKEFWLKHWESKKNLVIPIGNKIAYGDIFDKLQEKHQFKNSIELGGFPGHYSIYLAKKHQIKPTLLDYVIHPIILKDLLEINKLPENAIELIETDLFNYQPNKTYQLVFSLGLIEHFENTKEVLALHLPYLQNGGILYVSLPNFRGLNGWFQKKFDMDNYLKHNINCMDIDFLKAVCAELGLKNIKVSYAGGFMLWLENEDKQPFWVKLLKKTIWFPLKVLVKIIPFESKALSPIISITAEK